MKAGCGVPPDPHPAFRHDPPVCQSPFRNLGKRPSAPHVTSDPVISVATRVAEWGLGRHR